MDRIWWWVAAGVVAWLILQQMRGGARPDEVKAFLKKGARVIDVRTPAEFARGHLAKAVNVPLDEFSERLAREVPDKQTPLLLHCASGARSAAAKRVAAKLGYANALNLGSYGRAARLLDSASD